MPGLISHIAYVMANTVELSLLERITLRGLIVIFHIIISVYF